MNSENAPKPGTPKPAAHVDPAEVLGALEDMERGAQIDALEAVHSELASRLSRAQA